MARQQVRHVAACTRTAALPQHMGQALKGAQPAAVQCLSASLEGRVQEAMTLDQAAGIAALRGAASSWAAHHQGEMQM